MCEMLTELNIVSYSLKVELNSMLLGVPRRRFSKTAGSHPRLGEGDLIFKSNSLSVRQARPGEDLPRSFARPRSGESGRVGFLERAIGAQEVDDRLELVGGVAAR